MESSETQPDDLPALIDRQTEYATVTKRLRQRTERCLHVYGPKGSGKTLLVRHALHALPAETTVCFLSCLQLDTQYKVLTALCATLTDRDISTGYHTAQLYSVLTETVADQELVIVLDDIDFLLENDGNELLYTLSRLEQHRPYLVAISANHPDLTTELDTRTASSLQPATVDCPAYSEATAVRILRDRAPDWVDRPVIDDALARLAATTTNIDLGSYWLRAATDVTDGPITENIIRLVRPDAIAHYRTAQLGAFSEQHQLLLDAIELLTADTEPVRSGAVYDWYRQRCRQAGTAPLSTRRISDFLTHLELLDLIRVEYHYGGDEGKTRSIWLREFQ